MFYHNQEMKLQPKPLRTICGELKSLSKYNDDYLILDIQAIGKLKQSNKDIITATFKRHKCGSSHWVGLKNKVSLAELKENYVT